MPKFASPINEETKDDRTWDASNDPGNDGLDTNGHGPVISGDTSECGGICWDGDNEGQEHADEADCNEEVELAAVLPDTGVPGDLPGVVQDTAAASEAVVTKTGLASSLTR